jgi:hypothetical protein
MSGRQRNATNAQSDSNYDGTCTSRHCLSGTYEISGRLIFVEQSVPCAWTDPVVRRKEWKRDIRFGTWNESLYRCGSLSTVASKLATYKLVLVGVQEVRCDKGAL